MGHKKRARSDVMSVEGMAQRALGVAPDAIAPTPPDVSGRPADAPAPFAVTTAVRCIDEASSDEATGTSGRERLLPAEPVLPAAAAWDEPTAAAAATVGGELDAPSTSLRL